jgi:glutamyl-tRNA synthetase
LGNYRTALLAWLAARWDDGEFLLRMDDIDGPRTVEGAADQQLRELEWLGLTWDGDVVYQSQRYDLYQQVLDDLETRGLIYWCTCSRKEIANAVSEASAPHGDEGPIYPGTCRNSNKAEQLQHPNGAAARLLLPDEKIGYDDVILGEQSCNLARDFGDLVVKRRDGLWAYQLACAIDDAMMGITQVVRGADLVTSTFRQLYIMQAADLTPPAGWWHVPLMLGPEGERMSKRFKSETLAERRAKGQSAAEIIGDLAASVGLWPENQPATPDELLYELRKTGINEFIKILRSADL